MLRFFVRKWLSNLPPVDLYLISEKINLEKSSLTNWIFSLQKSITKAVKIKFEID